MVSCASLLLTTYNHRTLQDELVIFYTLTGKVLFVFLSCTLCEIIDFATASTCFTTFFDFKTKIIKINCGEFWLISVTEIIQIKLWNDRTNCLWDLTHIWKQLTALCHRIKSYLGLNKLFYVNNNFTWKEYLLKVKECSSEVLYEKAPVKKAGEKRVRSCYLFPSLSLSAWGSAKWRNFNIYHYIYICLQRAGESK